MKKSYKVFQRLCKEKKVTASRVSKETGISKSTFSEWKKGTYNPKIDKLVKIADFFGCDVKEFLV